MKALLLAAGYGTRLEPLTKTIPKCLVPINGKPLLDYWINTLIQIGIKQILINTHYLHQQVEEFVNNHPLKKHITLIYEKKLLGTAGTLLKNEIFFKSDSSLMLIHADNFSIFDYKFFLTAHKQKPSSCMMTMLTFITDTPQLCGIVTIDKENVMQNFFEKVENPPSKLANGAVYIIDYSIFNFLRTLDENVFDFSTDVLPHLKQKVYTVLNNNIHIDIGTVKNYQKANTITKKYLND